MRRNQQNNPLDQSYLEKLNQVCKSCGETQGLIDKLQAAGLDVSQAQQENMQQRTMAENLKRQFFPGSP